MTYKQPNPVFEVGERVTIAGFHKNYTPRIVAIDRAANGSGYATVKTDGLPGSERRFKLNEVEKIKP